MTFKKILLKNICLAFATVIIYSPGLLDLRPWDANIVRASLSISLGILICGMFVVNNMKLFEKKPKKTDLLEDAVRVLREFGLRGSNQIEEAKIALNQEKQMKNTLEDLDFLIKDRFGDGSLSYQRFIGARDSINQVVSGNLIGIANHILLFTENEKDDEELMERNHEEMQRMLDQNDQLLKQGNQLALELASGKEDQDILGEIKKLTKEVKLYQ